MLETFTYMSLLTRELISRDTIHVTDKTTILHTQVAMVTKEKIECVCIHTSVV